MFNLDDYKNDFEKIIGRFKEEIKTLRTGRAHPSLIENVMVEAYGVITPIKQLANIMVSDAKTLTIEPWDKNILKDVEKAIVLADLGVTPVNDGKVIRVPMPTMTEESRRDMVKILGQKVEQTRINIRQLRDKVKEEVTKAEKAKEITEDDKFVLIKKLDEMVSDYNQKIKAVAVEKEQEIMRV